MLSRAQAYLAYRRALGYELQNEGVRLLNFARYTDGLGHRGPLTTELAIRWACLPPKADRRYWASRLEIIRRFARHLLLSEPKTQVPPRHLLGPAYRRNPPHLYSSGEIQHLLRRAGQLKGRLRSHTFQTLLGLLACTGLRISEALNLKTSDVDLEQLVVVVRQSKWGKSRLVPLHPTALPPLRAYVHRRHKLFPLAEQFFLSERGVGLTYTTVRRTFLQLRAGIPYIQAGSALLAGGVSSALQTAATTAGAAATASTTGLPLVTAGAAGIAAVLSTMSSAANMGSAGAIIIAGSGLPPRSARGRPGDDITGDKAVRDLIAKSKPNYY